MKEPDQADARRGEPETEARARDILGLNDLQDAPPALPVRVERMWWAENFAPHITYSGSILIPMGHAADPGLWRESIAMVAQRHEALHSRLAVAGGRARMLPARIDDATALDSVNISRADLDAHRQGHRVAPLAEFFATRINLFEEPGFRCRVFRDETGHATLGILMHHYYGDAWSSQILRRELETILAAQAADAAPELPPVAQYSEYALAQRQALAKNLPAYLGYWRKRLAGAPPVDLPFDRHDERQQSGRMVFILPPALMAKMTRLSRTIRVSLPMLCLGAFQLILAEWCGQSQVVTGVTSADRLQPRFRNTMGHLLVGIPVATTIVRDLPVRDFLSTLAKDFYTALAHRDLAFEQYDEIFSPPQPFCNTRFNFIPSLTEFSTGGESAAMPELSGIARLPDINKTLTYRDLHFLLMEYPDGVVVRVIYSLDFSSEKIEGFIAAFRRVLENIVSDPDATLGDIVSSAF